MIVFAPASDQPRPAPEIPDPEPERPPVPPDLPQPEEPPGIPAPAPNPVPAPEPGEVPQPAPPELPAADMRSRLNVPRLFFVAAVLAVLMACIAGAASATAQTSDETPDESPRGPCQARPSDQGRENKDKATDQDNRENKTLAEKLDRCDGVLVPPKTGDKKIEEPAPDTGTTPVIPPEAVPKQQTPK